MVASTSPKTTTNLVLSSANTTQVITRLRFIFCPAIEATFSWCRALHTERLSPTMSQDAYETILSSIIADAERRDGNYVNAVESAAYDHFHRHFPDDDTERVTAALGIVIEGDAAPSSNWQKRLDDIETASPSEVADALAADVLISDALGAS